MTDQELEKLAEETIIIGSGVYKYDYQNILQALRIVRDAQEEKMKWITSEIKCRIDHGAESNGHLEGLLKIIEERK